MLIDWFMMKKMMRKKSNLVEINKVKDDYVLNKNIYGYKTGKEFKKNFIWFDTVFKHVIVKPLINLGIKWLDKKINVNYDRLAKENRNFVAFEDSVEKSVRQWNGYFFLLQPGLNGCKNKEEKIVNGMNGFNNRIILFLKKVVLYTALNDSAYRNLLNIFFLNFYKAMYDVNGCSPSTILFSSKNIDDPAFFYAVQQLNINVNRVNLSERVHSIIGGKK